MVVCVKMMLKGSKEALTVERVKSVLCIKWPLAPPKYAVRAHNIFTHNFLNIQCYVCWSMLKGPKFKITFNPFNINSIVWLKRSKSQLSKTFFGLKIGWILRKLWIKLLRLLLTPLTWVTWVTIKTVKASFNPFDIISHIHPLLWSFVLTNPLMYTQQIRWQWWQWVASSLSNLK